ncbi:uncharacterized protein LOC112348022 isoform X1 [Selaginella moellendorffii]|uniref:uncharacterized protein LOC112348022 isoform X1 n=1 Tax=Selaginella moellendorffii TaxID=88036 RepID=UPI000D1C58CF|nr:uncharacterized protein LOC112348022 isoform X1 [Selaginella moellendorffii]|eukprot:XP_024535669.1 uncharacterized protein LOC112348022 isoform X1 [Selaginella moellendorffii]
MRLDSYDRSMNHVFESRAMALLLGRPCCAPPRSSFWHGLSHKGTNSRDFSRISCAAAAGGSSLLDSSLEHCLFVRRSVNRGEIVEHSGGVVVFGNIERGGAVRADGDVIVLGSLEGICQAGRNGKESIVFSLGRGFSSAIEIANNPDVCVRKPGGGEAFIAMASTSVERDHVKSIFARLSRPARAAFFTGIYISIAGICFFVFPETLFGWNL